MNLSKLLLCQLFLMTSGGATAQLAAIQEKDVAASLILVDKKAIEDRIRFLADDKLLGRLPGTHGYAMAVDFVVKELKAIGVKPKGEKEYLQYVPLRKGSVDTLQSTMTVSFPDGAKKLKYGRDFALAPDLNRTSAGGEGTLVFAGYGISAPHLSYDDYKSIDVKGKIVVLQEGAPQEFPASERAHFNLAVSKCALASQRGAIGVVLLAAGNEPVRMSGLTRTSIDGITAYLRPDKKAFSSRTNHFEAIGFLGYVKASMFPELQTDKTPRDLGLKVKVQITSSHLNSTSENIVGVIAGTDPTLKEEYVVHTAHLDHVGVGTPVNGDSIYNGAHDNASGTACLLEIAKLYTKAKLKRSVLIVFVTSEEKGLLGSGFFAENPTVPREKIVADVNTDMPTIIAPLLSIEPLGASHSSLMNEVKNAAAFLQLDVMEDHMPEQVRFVRSDQYSFIRQGIPALHVKYGLKSADPTVDLRKKIDDWTAANYHKPSDEYSPEAFDFDAGATYVKLNFLIGWQVANTTARPTWNKGDFFGETFGNRK